MAGPDFGILQPLQGKSGLVANIPQQPNALAEIGNGITQGVQNYSNLQTQALQRQAIQQKMSQDAATFPDTLQQSHNATELSNMSLAATKQGAKDAAARRAAALAGPDQFEKVLGQQDPTALQKYQIGKADLQNKIQTNVKLEADTEAAQLKNYNSAVTQIGQITRTAAAGKTPELQQQIYSMALSQAPDSIKKILPPQFNPTLAAAGSQLYQDAHNEEQAKRLEKSSPTDMEKNQYARNVAQARIDKATQAGQKPDPGDVQIVSELNQAIQKDIIGKTKVPANPYNAALATQDAKVATNASNIRDTSSKLIQATDDLNNILKLVPVGYTGPIVNYLKANGFNTQIQEIQKLQADIPFHYRTLLGFTGGTRFTQGMLDQINKAMGSTGLNRDSLMWVVNRTHDLAVDTQHEAYEKERGIRSYADKDKYDDWLKNNPAPDSKHLADSVYQPGVPGATKQPSSNPALNVPDGRVAVKGKDGKMYHIPKEQLQEALKPENGYTLPTGN